MENNITANGQNRQADVFSNVSAFVWQQFQTTVGALTLVTQTLSCLDIIPVGNRYLVK